MGLTQAFGSSASQNTSQSVSQTYGTQASQMAQQVAAQSTANAYNAWKEAAEYNAEQARIQREWQEKMSNTVYQRTVEDMKKAGINPILAAGMGLGTASVSGGSAASISPSQVYNAQTFADSMSASQAQGSSYSKSENGLLTFITALNNLATGLIGNMNSSHQIEIAIEGLEAVEKPYKEWNNDYKSKTPSESDGLWNWIKNQLDPRGSGLFTQLRNIDKTAESFKKWNANR